MDPEANSFSKEAGLLGFLPLVPAVDDSESGGSCLAVLLPYMGKGEELVMQPVKDCNTNYCCPEVTVLPLEREPGLPLRCYTGHPLHGTKYCSA